MRYEGKLSVVIPAYNEAERLPRTLRETSRALSAFMEDYEILTVDDGSTDGTWAAALAAAAENSRIRPVHLKRNSGKGRALCVGTALSRGEYIAFCDADLELHPRQLECFMALLREERADAVIGCKLHPDSHVDYPRHRRFYSVGYYWMLRLLFRLDTWDTQTGLKLFRAEVLRPVMRCILVKRYAFDIEVLSLIQAHGGKIVSAPITMGEHRFDSHIRLKDVWDMFWDTLRVFYRLRILRYYQRCPENPEITAAIEAAETP